MYFSPIFIGSGNGEGHVRLDQQRLANYEIDYSSEYPFLYNLCKSLDGSNPNSSYCDSEYNFSSTHKFSAEEFFSPFYYSSDTPENNARSAGESFNHYDNSLYLKKFNPSLSPSFLTSLDANPNLPMIISQNGGNQVNTLNVDLPCSSHAECGEDGFCYVDDNLYTGGLCLSGEQRTDYIVITNNTFKDHSFRQVYYLQNNGSEDTRDITYNHEFIATNGTHALIFNNVLHNHASDIYDLNFRGTNYRSEKNKNLIQVIERNLISNGDKGKATGEGNPESKMLFTNNIIHNVRIGGYHAFFNPFYLNNTMLTKYWPY